MPFLIRASALLLCASIWASTHTAFAAGADPRVGEGGDGGAGRQAGQAAAVPEGPGKEIFTRKCFQCHQVGMWSSIRQDRKAWEGVLYRMVGRGALWTEAEINAMADFLAQTRGPR